MDATSFSHCTTRRTMPVECFLMRRISKASVNNYAIVSSPNGQFPYLTGDYSALTSRGKLSLRFTRQWYEWRVGDKLRYQLKRKAPQSWFNAVEGPLLIAPPTQTPPPNYATKDFFLFFLDHKPLAPVVFLWRHSWTCLLPVIWRGIDR